MRIVYVFFVLAWAVPSFAGLVVTATVTRGAERGSLKQFFQNGNARVDFKYNAGDGSFIIHSVSGEISWIDHIRKSYLQVNQGDLDRVVTLLKAFNQQVPTASNEVKVQKQAKAQTVGKWSCTRYDVSHGGKNSAHFCVVPMETVGATPADYKALQSLIDSVTKTGLVPGSERAMLEIVDKALKLGFVVQSSEQGGGTMVVDNIQKEKLSEATFAAPAGYTRTDITSLLQKQMMKPSGK